MSQLMKRAGFGAMALFVVAAVVGVSTASAYDELGDDIKSTTCGAGTEKECGMKPIIQCDFSLKFGIDPTTRKFEFDFGRRACHSVGEVPIYKDMIIKDSVLSGSCNLMNPFLGMPAGSGCSED